MNRNRILTIQDISCVGQCSLTVALPILAACGHETVILPTAVLSSHTGGFTDPNFRNLAEDLPKISACWQREHIDFDAVLTGYLGSVSMIDTVKEICTANGKPGCLRIMDPAMGDHGRLYKGFDEAYAQAMKQMVAGSDIALPNITEAAMMTGLPYKEEYGEDYIRSLMQAMLDMGTGAVILTGVSYEPGTTGVATLDRSGAATYYSHEKIGKGMHGTGDIFAAAFTGAYLNRKTFGEAARIAADFACSAIRVSQNDPAHAYGTKYELVLPQLMEQAR
ncbi:MAG: pyridoxamine kinase [Firmicutes bacterium]|nr:pyridoxamine kinase [Bacillota bacterium]